MRKIVYLAPIHSSNPNLDGILSHIIPVIDLFLQLDILCFIGTYQKDLLLVAEIFIFFHYKDFIYKLDQPCPGTISKFKSDIQLPRICLI